VMLSNARLARWQSHEQRAATRWCARTAGSSSAIIVTRQLMDTTISSMSFLTLICLAGCICYLRCESDKLLMSAGKAVICSLVKRF